MKFAFCNPPGACDFEMAPGYTAQLRTLDIDDSIILGTFFAVLLTALLRNVNESEWEGRCCRFLTHNFKDKN